MLVRKSLLDRFAEFIAGKVTAQSSGYEPYTPSDPRSLKKALKPGDILLVEGNQKVSAAIKYLTQSTWSHAAMYVGDILGKNEEGHHINLIEVNLGEGCVSVPLEKYRTYNTRICRAVDLTDADRTAVTDFMVNSLGTAYDTHNILDMARYLLPTPPVPVRWRRKLLSFGSGDPTRAICSTLIAQAFQNVSYPILPDISRLEACLDDDCETYAVEEILHIRHHSLFAPRDFDLSPFFQVIKPTIEDGFDYRNLVWADRPKEAENAKDTGPEDS